MQSLLKLTLIFAIGLFFCVNSYGEKLQFSEGVNVLVKKIKEKDFLNNIKLVTDFVESVKVNVRSNKNITKLKKDDYAAGRFLAEMRYYDIDLYDFELSQCKKLVSATKKNNGDGALHKIIKTICIKK